MFLNILTVLAVTGILLAFHSTGAIAIVNGVAIFCIVVGILFFLGATVGLLRFPDFYTRMHAAGKGDTLSSVLILFGCMLYTLGHSHLSVADILVGVKILLIVNFIFIGSPTATHAIIDAGYETEVKHWTKGKKS